MGKKNLLSFPPPSSGLKDVPQRIYTAASDSFIRLDVVDDLYAHMGFCVGMVFVAWTDKLIEGYLHYVEFDGYGFLARLTDRTESTVYVVPQDRETPADTYLLSELEYVAAIVEMYPRGLCGSRWVLRPKAGEKWSLRGADTPESDERMTLASLTLPGVTSYL
jgi:hypothetical protein